MRPAFLTALLVASSVVSPVARAGQAPGAASDADVPVSHRDRVYAAEQFSNTVSVTDPADNKVLGVIRLGDPAPGNLSPLYRGGCPAPC
jgi:YVTN family beta-propeller protein